MNNKIGLSLFVICFAWLAYLSAIKIDDAHCKKAVDRQLSEREKLLILVYEPKVNLIRTRMGLKPISCSTVDDLIKGFIEPVVTTHEPTNTGTNDANSKK